MNQKSLTLVTLPETLAVVRLAPTDAIPAWAMWPGTFFSVSRTQDELSIVCAQSLLPTAEIKAERDWRCLKVQGPLDFGLTGILASLLNPLAAKGISIFAVSTFDTDYLLVKSDVFETATAALTEAGHRIQRS